MIRLSSNSQSEPKDYKLFPTFIVILLKKDSHLKFKLTKEMKHLTNADTELLKHRFIQKAI